MLQYAMCHLGATAVASAENQYSHLDSRRLFLEILVDVANLIILAQSSKCIDYLFAKIDAFELRIFSNLKKPSPPIGLTSRWSKPFGSPSSEKAKIADESYIFMKVVNRSSNYPKNIS